MADSVDTAIAERAEAIRTEDRHSELLRRNLLLECCDLLLGADREDQQAVVRALMGLYGVER